MSIFTKFFGLINGWKTILGYLIAQVGGSYPLILAAFVAFKANPTDPQAITNLIAQLGIVVGLIHKFIKNLKKISQGEPVTA